MLATSLRILMLGLCLGACSKTPQSAETAERSYEVRGVVREAPDLLKHSVMIEHEDVPGFMPSMTMPFGFRDAKEVEAFGVGDAVAFKLFVTNKDSWISGIRRVDAASVTLPAAAPSAVVVGKVERVKEGDRLPDFELVDQAGRMIRPETFAGKALLVTFIFTRCPIPNFCPLMANNFREIHRAIRTDAALAGKVNLLSISFDKYDTPQVLAEYGARFSDDLDAWRFATGKPEEVQKLTKAFAVQVQPEAGTISHGLATVLIGPDGIVRKIWRGNGWKVDEVLAALRQP
jgi:protein SCO1/2